MLVLDSWLREFVNPPVSTEELAESLTMAGLEVESIQKVAPEFSGVVIAEIVSIVQHPNADKLRICQVDYGKGETIQIVCGAPNAKEGIKVPLATIGAVLPGDFKISKSKLRGEESFGMLCSAKELGISADASGLLVLDENLRTGTDIREALNLDDVVYEIKLTPNRADCLSVYGVAREVSALFKLPLEQNSTSESIATNTNIKVPKVNIKSSDLCGRFTARVITGVDAKCSTPKLMVDRLERSGQRSVSVLVDISNYVMLELGRPTHIFDLDKIHGDLTVSWGAEGQKLKLLNETDVELSSDLGVIYSDAGPECLAGIMGGHQTAVDLNTKNIFIEAAFWYPDAIAGRARKLKIPSEASHRFERGVDYQSNIEHINYITKLIIDICGGEASEIDDQKVNLPAQKTVDMRLSRCQKVLGVPVTSTQVEEVFKGLGFEFDISDSEADTTFKVVSPSYRFDIEIEEDLIEEVARIYGYDNIPALSPKSEAVMHFLSESKFDSHQIRELMVTEGFQEVVNYSFVDAKWEEDFLKNPNPVKLLNPIASNLSVMRSSLILSLVNNIVYNSKRKQSSIKLFEIARVFAHDEVVQDSEFEVKGISQCLKLAGAVWGLALPAQWGIKTRPVDFFDLKKVVENIVSDYEELKFKSYSSDYAHVALHPGRSASIFYKGLEVGFIGELHPKLTQIFSLNSSPIVFEIDLEAVKERSLPKTKSLSKQQISERDLAIWIASNLEYAQVADHLSALVNLDDELSVIRNFYLFDVWTDEQNPEEKSIAIKFIFQGNESSLEDAQVESAMDKILSNLTSKFNARLR